MKSQLTQNIEVVDAHVHIGPSLPSWRKCGTTGEDLIKGMDVNCISKACVMTDTRVAWEDNRKLAETVNKYSDRLFGCCSLDLRGEDIASEFKEYIRMGFKAIKIYPNYFDVPANNEILYPIMEVCEEYSVPVIIHSDVWDPRSNPFTIGDLASQFPEVEVIMAHMSARLTFSCIEAAQRNKNIYLDTSGSANEVAIARAVKKLGAKRVIFGSDWPDFEWEFALSKFEIYMKDISQDDMEMILGKNILRIFGVE